ncbi:CdaR family protein [Lacticaseibacillus zhaodongensis]|uniref:CdaR family protein n=1 Tax=Lacticaseibacillus zhaodongensis TaxID=2668065 RepID=UPI0012D2F5B5|nr:CdaR family protein [Lacticaseibacillus zhaodongensis]
MSKIWDSPWMYRILSLILALGIFAYVNAEKLNNSVRTDRNDNTAILATKKQTVKVPLELNADTDKYFITGYPEKVAVKVEGNAALVTAVANTQNFRVYADLRNLGVGQHTVALKQQGLSNQLTYSIEPKTIKVNIQNRISKTMAIQVHYNKEAIADGYQVGTPRLSSNSVQVTGARNEIDRIYEISASVTLNRNTNNDVTQTVMLQALDSNGQTVNVVVTPETVRVKLPISLPSKKVKLDFKQSGTPVTGFSYSFKSDTDYVTIRGSQRELDRIDRLTVPVDVSGLSKDTKKTVDLRDANKALRSISPQSVAVNIQVQSAKAAIENSSLTGQ